MGLGSRSGRGELETFSKPRLRSKYRWARTTKSTGEDLAFIPRGRGELEAVSKPTLPSHQWVRIAESTGMDLGSGPRVCAPYSEATVSDLRSSYYHTTPATESTGMVLGSSPGSGVFPGVSETSDLSTSMREVRLSTKLLKEDLGDLRSRCLETNSEPLLERVESLLTEAEKLSCRLCDIARYRARLASTVWSAQQAALSEIEENLTPTTRSSCGSNQTPTRRSRSSCGSNQLNSPEEKYAGVHLHGGRALQVRVI